MSVEVLVTFKDRRKQIADVRYCCIGAANSFLPGEGDRANHTNECALPRFVGFDPAAPQA